MRSAAPADLDSFLAAHAGVLESFYARAGAAERGVSREDFAAALHRSALQRFGEGLPDAPKLENFLGALHLEDLALACALRQGREDAWEGFVTRTRPVLYAAARVIVASAGEARARELADSLWADLYGVKSADGGAHRSLLEYFQGRSKLTTWLRAVLAQRHVDALRAGSRTAPIEAAEGCAAGASSEDGAHPTASARDPRREPDGFDPDRQRLVPRLREAVSKALAGLPPGDRLLLSLYYVDDLTLAQIGRFRGVHEATASRQLARIARDLRELVERDLSAGEPARDGRSPQAGLSHAQIELCFRYALEDWPFDLRRELSRAEMQAGPGEP